MNETGRGRTALITGASGGIGEGLARECAAAGMDVVLVARSENELKALADRFSAEHGVTAHSVRFSPRAIVRPTVKRLQERVH